MERLDVYLFINPLQVELVDGGLIWHVGAYWLTMSLQLLVLWHNQVQCWIFITFQLTLSVIEGFNKVNQKIDNIGGHIIHIIQKYGTPICGQIRCLSSAKQSWITGWPGCFASQT